MTQRYIEYGPISLTRTFCTLKGMVQKGIKEGYKIKFNWEDDSFCTHEFTVLNAAIRAAVEGANIKTRIPICDLIYTLLYSIEQIYEGSREGVLLEVNYGQPAIENDFSEAIDALFDKHFSIIKKEVKK